MKVLTEVDVSGKRVFVRADLDVDVERFTVHSSQFTDATRLKNLKSTVDYLISHNAKQIIIAGHIGRPSHEATDGKPANREKLSTKRLVPVLEKLLGQKIEFSPDVILSPKDEESQQRSFANAQDDNKRDTHDDKIGVEPLIILLENLRFWAGEEKNDSEFAKQLASMTDIYINEAFGVSHRAHASIVGVPAILPHAAGLHLEEEVDHLTKLIEKPQRPMVAIIGGAKLETKVPVIESLSKGADWVLVGGLVAKQLTVDSSQLTENSKVKIATLTSDTKDIDEESIGKFTEIIKGAKTVVWNGPVGYFEGGFKRGTLAIAQAVIDSGAYSVIGGGETTEFLGSKNLLSKFSFVSSGGGAMLEFLSGKEIPGIVALS